MFPVSHQPTSFRELIEQIRSCNALSVIGLMIEEYRVLFDDQLDQRVLLDELYDLRNLDLIRLGCAMYLGHHEEAQRLTDWLAQQGSQPRQSLRDHLDSCGDSLL